ncbi:MAG: ABC transporter ATP-binding protein [Methylocella sp.]
MSSLEPILRVRNLSAGIAGAECSIIADVSFDLAPREILGIIGATGSGKTVLSRAIVNWLEPPLVATGGSVSFKGQDILHLPGRAMRGLRREIAYVGANPMGALDPTLAVGPQIVEKLHAVAPEVGRDEAKRRVIELLDAVRIPSARTRFHDFPSQFSGGMMQRALIVDALVSNPAFLVADNVTQPLDVTVAAQVLRLLRELTERFETAIVFVSSSLPIVCDAANMILVLDEGRVVEQKSRDALIAHPSHPYTVDLLARTPKIWSGTSTPTRPQAIGEPVLSVRGASRSYHLRRRGSFAGKSEVRAVRNVNFDVYAGENFGIVGESGCGKSSLMRLLSRLERPDSGQILCGGVDMATLSGRELLAFRRKVQLVLQDPFGSLPPRTAIGAMIEAPLRVHGERDGKVRRERVLAMMREVGLSPNLYDQLPLGLSAGQRQRINVARAMILEPHILIMDETLSALDQSEQLKLLDLFERLQAKHRLTYIFISHDMALVRRTCDRVAVMYLGEVVEVSRNERLFFDPGHPYSRALLSAIPTLEERRYRAEDCLLDGEPPNPIDLPIGCGFAGRCPNAYDRCRAESPNLLARGDHDLAACFLVETKWAPALEEAHP